MRLIIAAIGRLKAGAEQELVARYLDRIAKSGKAVGVTKIEIIELPESRASSPDERKSQEASALLARLPEGSVMTCFDEHGKSPSSNQFAKSLKAALETGAPAVAFILGGPDGLSSELRKKAHQNISFGAMTMPHQLARVLATEQVYRAITILTNHPYHRN